MNVIPIIIAPVIMALSIILGYYRQVNNDNKPVIDNWPIFSIVILLTVISNMSGQLTALKNKYESNDFKYDKTSHVIFFYFNIMALILLLYPGLNVLKLNSDKSAFIVLPCLGLCSALCYYYSMRLCIRATSENKPVILHCFGVLISCLIYIFIGPYLMGGGSKYIDY